MGLFSNPVLESLEDLLWRKARQRYIDEGGSPIEDAKELDKRVRTQFKKWVKGLVAQEDEKLKPVWREFKKIVTQQTLEALTHVMQRSEQSWYSVEIPSVDTLRKAMAVPYKLLKARTEEALPDLLVAKIQFKDMLPETRKALSAYGVARNFEDVIGNARAAYHHFEVRGRLDHLWSMQPFVIVDVIERDFYHLGSQTTASRVDMVVLAVFESNRTDRDKEKHVGEKAAVKEWASYLDKRMDDRRFTGDGWGVSQAELELMADEAA